MSYEKNTHLHIVISQRDCYNCNTVACSTDPISVKPPIAAAGNPKKFVVVELPKDIPGHVIGVRRSDRVSFLLND